jgi:three-Cys-motif partner protein
MVRDINKSVFPKETKLKLDIFRECFREWYPVFLHNSHISRLYIYDMFAGSGKDYEGNSGSPLILLQEARGDKLQHCDFLLKKKAPLVYFGFNEKIQHKAQKLEQNIIAELNQCLQYCKRSSCLFSNTYKVAHFDFQDLIHNKTLCGILANKSYGKFIFLDQYGFKQINNDTFLKLVNSPKTDFIFFIASSFVKRFKTLPAVTTYFDDNKIIYDETKPKECHRVITNYFRELIPQNKEYYLHSFTIQKGPNYYGLIFGTSHTLGMEKFLRVCWKYDKLAGESNCNINNDYEAGTLFYDPNISNKRRKVSQMLREKILNGEISNNKDGLISALKEGCEPRLFVETIELMLKNKEVSIEGNFNKKATGIHLVEVYNIKKL